MVRRECHAFGQRQANLEKLELMSESALGQSRSKSSQSATAVPGGIADMICSILRQSTYGKF